MLREFFDNALRDLFAFRGGKSKRNGQVELRDKWNDNPHAFARDSDHFYKNEVGDSYLYDLAHWHASKTLYPWGQLVHGFARGRVWDFGGGIGTYTLFCAKKDTVEVVYYDDINPENQEFAQWRFKKHGVLDKVKFGTPRKKVDTIIALDVVEHLTDPAKQLILFNMLTDQGASMVVNATTHTSGGQHPMHIMDETGARKWWDEVKKTWESVHSGSPSAWRKK